ncbi:hypothetical protein NBRC116602_24090 [Hyphomicrobiales bacterium 4NK60-0047b]
MIENSKITPLVSVILPAYNGGKELSLAIQSIEQQTYQNWELILMDDGSTDGSLELMESLTDPRIKLFSDGVNKGLSQRLNEAVSKTKGQYIARMDADDIAFPKRLETQVNFLEKNKDIDLVGCRAVAFRENGKIIGLLPFASDHISMTAQVWRNIPLPHPTWMGKASWFKENPYADPEVRRSEDQELLLRTHSFSRFACLPDVLFGYRQGPFNFRLTMIARKALYIEQVRYFKKQKEWKNIFNASIVSTIKIIVDCIATIPGCQALFFQRMSEDVPEKVKQELNQALDKSE